MASPPSPPGRVPGADAATAVSATLAAGQEGLAQLGGLAPGQQVQGTVIQVLGDGQVTLGLLGRQLLARANLTLAEGNSYAFTVTATDPQIVLTAARPLILPTASGVVEAGLLGPGGSQVASQLLEFLERSPSGQQQDIQTQATQTTQATQATPVRQVMQRFLGNLAAGSLEAGDLRQMQVRLGHDQEARVLRLGNAAADVSAQQREAALLRQTLKAEALRFLDSARAGGAEPAVTAAARSLAEGLSRVESDNAHRAEQGAPQWLPLPVGENGFLRDARMFVLASEQADARQQPRTGTGRRGFLVVLLLDLTRLGQVRVDLEVHGDTVGVTFRAGNASTLHLVHGARGELEQQLREQGLEVRFIRIRETAGATPALPVADLLTPPTAGGDGPETMVDVHA